MWRILRKLSRLSLKMLLIKSFSKVVMWGRGGSRMVNIKGTSSSQIWCLMWIRRGTDSPKREVMLSQVHLLGGVSGCPQEVEDQDNYV